MAKTILGASGQTVPSYDILEYICGKNAVSRCVTFVTQYRGRGNAALNKFLDANHYCFFNVNYEPVKKTSSGDKLPNPFPKDLDKYKKDITPIFEYYKNHKYKDNIIWVCENEPTTKAFHSGPMADYLKMLRIFVDLGKQYGYKCIDGAVHVDRVMAAKQPGAQAEEGDSGDSKEEIENRDEESVWDLDIMEALFDWENKIRIPGTDIDIISPSAKEEYRGSSTQVTELLNGYRTIPDMYAVNIHTANIGGDYDSAKIKKCVDKIMSWTGHPTVSNEWHVENSNNTELISKMAKGFVDAGVEWTVYLSGAGGSDVTLNSGMNLTPFGKAYRDFIANWKGIQ